ncbi:hypothetical protein DXG01_015351, partial [Tephrocybe rancida]
IKTLAHNGKASRSMALPLPTHHRDGSNTAAATRNARGLVPPLPRPAPPRIQLRPRPPSEHAVPHGPHEFLHHAPAQGQTLD